MRIDAGLYTKGLGRLKILPKMIFFCEGFFFDKFPRGIILQYCHFYFYRCIVLIQP